MRPTKCRTGYRADLWRAAAASLAPSTLVPRSPTSTPKNRNMRSVWSRDFDGSSTVVSPSAYNPARRTADLTCALATGLAYSMDRRVVPPPLMASGARVPPERPSIFAPIFLSGSTILAMGRFLRYSSPERTEKKSCPASRPARSLMPVPELPRSSTPAGSERPFRPLPCTTRRSVPRPSMAIPIACIAFAVF